VSGAIKAKQNESPRWFAGRKAVVLLRVFTQWLLVSSCPGWQCIKVLLLLIWLGVQVGAQASAAGGRPAPATLPPKWARWMIPMRRCQCQKSHNIFKVTELVWGKELLFSQSRPLPLDYYTQVSLPVCAFS